ncbi:N-formylglutamate deformylase [Caenispirillum salinarum AK4]|uniref:N-formylglutamate deformylase n=1 Tax=Caenispirillum salinarum AK4 TaxID=1238182 RepID=K9H0B4_9PROT|nr:N-formylglutamate deformylase [Caenispirillum salinarum AK4]
MTRTRPDEPAPQDPRSAPDTPSSPASALSVPGVVAVEMPADHRLPMVFASPHSGRNYPDDLLAASRLDASGLRRSEDCFVDELFADVPAMGAPLVKALYPRAYLDPNREPYELDPAMFAEPLPAHVNVTSARVAAGLGTIARVVASGAEIYARKLSFAEAEKRVQTLYRPYHGALRRLIDETVARFGYCMLVDCHSMPSGGGDPNRPPPPDMVLGDCFGISCARVMTAVAEERLTAAGYTVTRNAPYAGGFTTRHYGRPEHGVHAMQIEINRRLYMDEAAFTRRPAMESLREDLNRLVEVLAGIRPQDLRLPAGR